MKPIRLLLVDDQSLFREALRTLLSLQSDFEVVGEAENGLRAVDLARDQQPDVILMDLRMPVLGGVEATRRILHHRPEARVVVLTTFDEDTEIIEALRAGALVICSRPVRPKNCTRPCGRARATPLSWNRRSPPSSWPSSTAGASPPRPKLATQAGRPALRARTGCAAAARHGLQQQGDRIPPEHRRRHGQESHDQRAGQAAGLRPHPGGPARPGARV
jgi:CheY-like chemotaxis protein